MTVQTFDIEKAVDYILAHLHPQLNCPLFPLSIMTKRLGYQMEVHNKEAMIRYFEWSDYQDCRVAAYPKPPQFGDNRHVAPNLIMIDLDLANHSGSRIALDAALKSTLDRVYRLLNAKPSVLWTGNGCHIYIPVAAPVLQQDAIFAEFAEDAELGTKFLRYAEQLFANGKQDPQHRPSVNSCLLRIPGTYNSKNGERVKIVQQWDAHHHRPQVHTMLRDFRVSLIEVQLAQVNSATAAQQKAIRAQTSGSVSTIRWIETLLQTPIADHRKYSLWRIFAPYFANVRCLSNDESEVIVRNWLTNCSKLRRLEGRPNYSFRYNLNNARRVGYYPISLNNLRKENPDLFGLIHYPARNNKICGQ